MKQTMNRLLQRLKGHTGFTMVEVTMACFIIAFVAVGVWGVYWSVINTYYTEQKSALIEAEGERILDLITNGGYCQGKRVYGCINTSHQLARRWCSFMGNVQ